MLELNHILKGSDLLSGSVAYTAPQIKAEGPVIFDLKAGGLFKIDSPNADRAQVASLETACKNS